MIIMYADNSGANILKNRILEEKNNLLSDGIIKY